MTNLNIDVTQLKGLASDLKKLSPDLNKSFLKGLGTAGNIVAEDARGRASFSSRIPGTIKVRRRGVAVRVVAGGEKAPHAAALEHEGNPGTFRHPVFGNYDVWVPQKAQPFLGPAAEAEAPKFTEAILDLVDDSFRRAGFH